MASNEDNTYSLSANDATELNKLVSFLELSSGTTTIFAIAPESGPQHPIVEEIKLLLADGYHSFKEPQNFFYSDNSLYNFLYSLDETGLHNSETKRELIMAFGIDQLPTSRLKQEMKQLNLGRDSLFGRELVIIFWLNKEEFLEEFRNRAPDFWDWRGKLVKFEARPPVNPLFYPYLEWLIAENSYLKISGVMQVQRQVDIFLDQIYVSLQAVRRQQIAEMSKLDQEMTTFRQADRLSMSISSPYDLDEPYYYEAVLISSIPTTSTKTVTQRIDLSHAVRENQYCVILGAPGAGKTTLLRYLALHFATAKRDGNEIVIGGEPQEELGKALLPIFFRIADYAERLQQEPELKLLDYLRQFYRQWEAYFQDEAEVGTEMATLLLEKMRQGQCLMLLDGLDEVFEQESRRLIVERIDQFVNAFSTNKFVITSRIAGYRDVKLSSRFAEFTIEDMGSEQVEKFLERWCLAIERAQQPEASEAQWQRAGDDQARKILEAIKDNEGVKRLTANPLLLTILALIHRNGERLPNRRVKLYELAVQTLTEDWQLGKKLPDAPKVLLNQNEVVAFLAPLAYWMHEEKPSGLVTEAEVEQQLGAKLAELNDTDIESDSVRQAVQEFLRKVRETTGLFVERAPGVYGFMHLTFEEYFAARYIADNEVSDILAIIRKHLHEPRWNEPILLALGYYGIYSPKQVNKLVEQLFSNLDAYEPVIKGGNLKIKNASSQDAIIIWSGLQEESTTNCNQSELQLKDLLFAGEVLTQVEVNSRLRRKLTKKLVITLVLGNNLEDGIIKQLLKLLRQIELFNNKSEVIACLEQCVKESTLFEIIGAIAQLSILYIACAESGISLLNCVTDIVNQLNPLLFSGLKGIFADLGEEMTPALEFIKRDQEIDQVSEQALNFITALSYIRDNNYIKAITLLEPLIYSSDKSLMHFITWALADCYKLQNQYEKASKYYQQTYDKLAVYPQQSSLLAFWNEWGACYRLQAKYKQSLECFQKRLAITQGVNDYEFKADTLYEIGKTYKAWGKYEEAIAYYQQSRDLYEQLGKDKDIANLWYRLADCYRDWGKYQEAVECEQKDLAICQQLDDQTEIALAHYQLGRIYQAWSKYEEAIAYHQQSRDLYEQLGKEKDVSNLWYWLADCYRDWGKYQEAIECEQKDLAIRQQLDDQTRIALAHYQLGRIYQACSKYELAIANYQQSCDLYEQLGKEEIIANLWYRLASCYREWGKYEQAVQCELKDLAIRQQLDDQTNVADGYRQLGSVYQAWGKYELAIANYQQSLDLNEQLDLEENVANLWYLLGDCYREWGKYEQAVQSLQKCLGKRQNLEEKSGLASAHHKLGRIYQIWGKYKEAIANYQQSLGLNEQLGLEENVANLWYLLAECYWEWGKYEQAYECEQKDLAIRQQMDDQPNVADAYKQLGHIYQTWGKYEQATAHYQQSCDLYEQLGKQKDVANLWYWLANCNSDWGKYEQALECQQHCLLIRQTLNDTSLMAVTYRQLGQIYQAWDKYEEAIAYLQQSRNLYEQLGKEKDIANLWYWLASCYRDWGKYQQALEYELKDLAIRQQLDDQTNVADSYNQLGRIYQAWGKYEQAIAYHQQSHDLYEQLGLEENIANQLSWIASCYRSLNDYAKAIEYYRQSQNLYHHLGHDESEARRYMQLGKSQRLLAKNTSDRAVVFEFLAQAEQNIRQAIQINTTGDYKKNLAYDYIIFSLICSERLRPSSFDDSSLQEQITQFEEYYNTGLTYLAKLGQTVNRAEEALDIARVYLEVSVLKNLDRAEELAQESLQVFQEYNHRKLEASCRKLLGEIYLNRAQHHQSDTKVTATQFLTESLQIYRELDLREKAVEVEQLMYSNLDNTGILSD